MPSKVPSNTSSIPYSISLSLSSFSNIYGTLKNKIYIEDNTSQNNKHFINFNITWHHDTHPLKRVIYDGTVKNPEGFIIMRCKSHQSALTGGRPSRSRQQDYGRWRRRYIHRRTTPNCCQN